MNYLVSSKDLFSVVETRQAAAQVATNECIISRWVNDTFYQLVNGDVFETQVKLCTNEEGASYYEVSNFIEEESIHYEVGDFIEEFAVYLIALGFNVEAVAYGNSYFVRIHSGVLTTAKAE